MNGVQHDYYYVDGVLMYEKVGTEYEMFYRYDTDGRLSMVTCRTSSGKKYYYNVVTNAQGDVVNLLGGSGAVRVTYTYDAYGRLVSMTDTTAGAIAIGSKNSIRYRGYVYDSEIEMYYLQSRYYDPETGRFINCDAPDYIGVSDTFTSWNGFAYCENDPVNNSDETGYFPLISLMLKKNYFHFSIILPWADISSYWKRRSTAYTICGMIIGFLPVTGWVGVAITVAGVISSKLGDYIYQYRGKAIRMVISFNYRITLNFRHCYAFTRWGTKRFLLPRLYLSMWNVRIGASLW